MPTRAQFIAYTDPSSAQRVNALDNPQQKVHEYLDVGTPEAMKVMQSLVQEAVEASEFSKGYQMGWWHYAVE
jgi:Spy/CpxP family protein refolding chaperone